MRIIWSNDWLKVALLINDVPQAMFDFEDKCGYSIDQFPKADPKTGWCPAAWKNELRDFFYPRQGERIQS